MAALLELPTELLRNIFAALADIDLLSFYAARRTSKIFQEIITDIINVSFANHGVAIHILLRSHFSPLLDSTSAGADYRPTCRQGHTPFYALPWSSDPRTRAKYLREEASWRQIPLASSSGKLVQRLHMINLQGYFTSDNEGHVWDIIGGGHVGFRIRQREGETLFYFPKGLPLGRLYDFLLRYKERRRRNNWEVLFETRVGFEEEVACCDWDLECMSFMLSLYNDPQALIKKWSKQDDHHALLVLGPTKHCCRVVPREEGWTPVEIGQDKWICEDFPTPAPDNIPSYNFYEDGGNLSLLFE